MLCPYTIHTGKDVDYSKYWLLAIYLYLLHLRGGMVEAIGDYILELLLTHIEKNVGKCPYWLAIYPCLLHLCGGVVEALRSCILN